jgi:hypothetical protein
MRYDRSMRARQPVGRPPFSPRQILGLRGWYDRSDLSTQFQDSAGSTPATAVEQQVGRTLDKSVQGNHETQTTLTSRPILRARYNLLTNSEFALGATGAAPSDWLQRGNVTGVKTVDATARSGFVMRVSAPAGAGMASTDDVRQLVSGLAFGAGYTVVGRVKAGAGNAASSIRLLFAATGSIDVPLTAGFTDFALAAAASNTAHSIFIGSSNTGAGIAVADFEFIDVRVTNDAIGQPAYQRVGTATDYDTVGFLPYLFCDGFDDGMSTAAIDFSNTDKVTVVAGVRKLSDAAIGMILELSNSIANDSTFCIQAPNSPATASYRFGTRGTVTANAVVTTGFPAPITNVISSVSDISGDIGILRVNGIVAAFTGGDQGTGNFGNYPLFLFRRGGISIPFNGRFYGLTIVGTLLPEGQLQQLEQWMNRKTGAY